MSKKKKKQQLLWIMILSFCVLGMLLVESRFHLTGMDKSKVFHKDNMAEEEEKQENKEERENGESQVRVLLKTTGFQSLFHKKVVITSKKGFVVKIAGKKKVYAGGKQAVFWSSDRSLKGKQIIITPAGKSKLTVTSMKRQQRNPSYRGKLQIIWKKKGLLLCNELPLEQYLYAVVPSELSTGNGMEALKAQAVCARSYAFNQINAKRYANYHAHVDDSVDFQVYNNVPEDKRSRKAVDATKGMVLTRNGKVVQTYYYSTSWGCSASGQSVWNTNSPISYLKTKLQIVEKRKGSTAKKKVSLKSEKAFAGFIEKPKYDTYDSQAPWYRWKLAIDEDSLAARIDTRLQECYAQNPQLVLTQTTNGGYEQKTLTPIGKIRKIRVERREDSGLVTELVIVGEKNVVKVCTQYNIRKILAPAGKPVWYDRGRRSSQLSLLPSGAFYIRMEVQGKKKVFYISGGGMGHGTGMSQCGAARMAELGKDYCAILAHYYDGTQLGKIDEVSSQVHKNGI